MHSPTAMPASSSSAAAPSAVRSPITSPARASATSCCWKRRSSPTARTWHAAGLVGQLRGKRTLTRLMQNSVAVFDRLEAETGQAIDWKKVGSLRLASQRRAVERNPALHATRPRASASNATASRAEEAQDMFPYHRSRRRRRRRLHSRRRLYRPLRADPGLSPRPRARLASRSRKASPSPTSSDRGPPGHRRRHRSRHHRLRHRWSTAPGCWAQARRRDGRRARWPPASSSTSISSPKRASTCRGPDHAARSRQQLLPEAGCRRRFAIGGWEDGTKGCWTQSPPFDFGRELFPPNMDRLELLRHCRPPSACRS